MFLPSPLVLALLLTAPAVRDHFDLDTKRDGADVQLDGDRALVTDGSSVGFYRFAGGQWTLEPMDKIPGGGGVIALAGDQAIIANDWGTVWSVVFTNGAWRQEAAIRLPSARSNAPISAVALAPGGRRAVVLRESVVLLTRGPGGFAASELPISEPVYGIAIDDDRVAVATRTSAIILEGADLKPAATLPLKLEPLPNGKPFVTTGRLVLHGDDLVIGFQAAKGFPAYAVVTLHRAGGEWMQTAVLRGSALGEAGATFALSGDRLLVGAPELVPTGCGQAFLFERKGRAWSAPLPLADPSRCTSHAFGGAVALAGRHAAIIATVAGGDSYTIDRIGNMPINVPMRGHPRRVYFYDLDGQVPPARFERLGVRTDGPGDWAGSLDSSLEIDHHSEQRHAGVRLVVQRVWKGIEATLCGDLRCLDREVIGRTDDPSEALEIRSTKLAELMESNLFVAGDGASGTLRRVEDRLVADLTVERTSISAQLVLSPTGTRDVDALLRERSSTVTSGPPPGVYAGTWLGMAKLPFGYTLAVWMRLTAGPASVKGVWCTEVSARSCKPVTDISMEKGVLRFSAPSSPAPGGGVGGPLPKWMPVPAQADLRLEKDALVGALERESPAQALLYLFPLGDRSLAEAFERVRTDNAAIKAKWDKRRARTCVCACWCGGAQPPGACPMSECDCAPCPRR